MVSKRAYLVVYISGSFCDLILDCVETSAQPVDVSETEELHASRFAVDCCGFHLWHSQWLSCDGRRNAGCALRFLQDLYLHLYEHECWIVKRGAGKVKGLESHIFSWNWIWRHWSP